jgi:hypothetical protein
MIRPTDAKLKGVIAFLQAAVSFAAQDVHDHGRSEDYAP